MLSEAFDRRFCWYNGYAAMLQMASGPVFDLPCWRDGSSADFWPRIASKLGALPQLLQPISLSVHAEFSISVLPLYVCHVLYTYMGMPSGKSRSLPVSGNVYGVIDCL